MLTLPNAMKLDKGITFYAISVAYFELLLQIEDCYNKNIEKRVVDAGWLQLIFVNDTTYDFIVPDTITSAHPNEILFAEIKFQWADPDDIDNVFDKIFITNITTSKLLDNSIKNY